MDMKTFLSRKDNETLVEVVKYDEKSRTYLVRFLNGEKEGTTVVYSSGTIKRWWKGLEVDKKATEEKEVATEKEEKTAPKKKIGKKVDRTKEFEELDTYIGNTFENSWYPSVKCYKIKKEGKTVAEIYPRRKNIEVRVKEIKDDFDSDVLYKDGYKYYLPIHYFVSYDTDYIRIIEDLLS